MSGPNIFLHLLASVLIKKTIDFNWVKSITSLSDDKVVAFIAYLDHIGFLYVTEPHPDPKKRKYRIPIIYMPIPGAQGF